MNKRVHIAKNILQRKAALRLHRENVCIGPRR
jgi:hypothetical protein